MTSRFRSLFPYSGNELNDRASASLDAASGLMRYAAIGSRKCDLGAIPRNRALNKSSDMPTY
jgi:hypothetical protein